MSSAALKTGLISIATLVALALTGWFAVNGRSRAEQEEDISEAVFRHFVQLTEVREHLESGSLFISKEDQHFDPIFLLRFAQHPMKLADRGALSWRHGAPWDAKTGAPAMILRIEKVRWLGWRRVEVDADYFCSPLCGYGARFDLHRSGWSNWSIDEVSGRWISSLFPNAILSAASRPTAQQTLRDAVA